MRTKRVQISCHPGSQRTAYSEIFSPSPYTIYEQSVSRRKANARGRRISLDAVHPHVVSRSAYLGPTIGSAVAAACACSIVASTMVSSNCI